MADLSAAELDLLSEVTTAPEAWVEAGPVEARWPGVAAGLVAAGWLAVWERPDYAALTLTPWGAERLHVRVTEHWRFESVLVPAGPLYPGRFVRERVGTEVPCWLGDQVEEGPVRLPRHAREVPLALPERVTADTREWYTDADGEPVVLWGQRVPVDRRLARGSRAG